MGSLLELADERLLRSIPGEHGVRLRDASRQLYEQLVLKQWLVRERQDGWADW